MLLEELATLLALDVELALLLEELARLLELDEELSLLLDAELILLLDELDELDELLELETELSLLLDAELSLLLEELATLLTLDAELSLLLDTELALLLEELAILLALDAELSLLLATELARLLVELDTLLFGAELATLLLKAILDSLLDATGGGGGNGSAELCELELLITGALELILLTLETLEFDEILLDSTAALDTEGALDRLLAIRLLRFWALDSAPLESNPLSVSGLAAPPPHADNIRDKVTKLIDSLMLFNARENIRVHLKIRKLLLDRKH